MGLLAAVLVVFLSRKFGIWQTIVLSWLAVFAMTLIVLRNSAVLPLDLLWVAVPWSGLEFPSRR